MFAVAAKLNAGTIDFVAGADAVGEQARWSAAVPLLTATACFMPMYSANAASNAATRGPCAS